MNDLIVVIVLLVLGIALGLLIGYGVGYKEGFQPECSKLGGEIINSQCVKVLK